MKFPTASVEYEAVTNIASGVDVLGVIAPVVTLADQVPRKYTSGSVMAAAHGYCEAVEFVSRFTTDADCPVWLVPVAIDTPGAVYREDTTGNTGTACTSLTVGANGVLMPHIGSVAVKRGGTVGTDLIVLTVSLDDGRSTRDVRLGTGTSAVLPDVGLTFGVTVGTLVAGDVIHTWDATGPRASSSDYEAAFAAFGEEDQQFRSVVAIGQHSAAEAEAFRSALRTYYETYGRKVQGYVDVGDMRPLAKLSRTDWRLIPGASEELTFAEVGATGDTLTRDVGSFITDGFSAGDIITISGTTSNDMTTTAGVTSVSALSLTFDTDDLEAETIDAADCVVFGEASIAFAAAGTITRNVGSWVADGFEVGMSFTVSGTTGCDGTYTVTAVTALVLTVASLPATETVRASAVEIVEATTRLEWGLARAVASEAITDDYLLTIGWGRGKSKSPYTRWYHRCPAVWRAITVSFATAMHVPTWGKMRGPLGDELRNNTTKLLEEWDDRVHGKLATNNRVLSFRTYANGPVGSFLAMDPTRETEGGQRSYTCVSAVVSHAENVCQRATEQAIGYYGVRTGIHLAETAIRAIEDMVNQTLTDEVLASGTYGPSATACKWTASRDDDMSGAEAVLTGVLTTTTLGIVHSVETKAKVA